MAQSPPPCQLRKDAPYLLQVLRKMHQGLLHFLESSTIQQSQALVSILIDLDTAQFGLNQVESRLELVDK